MKTTQHTSTDPHGTLAGAGPSRSRAAQRISLAAATAALAALAVAAPASARPDDGEKAPQRASVQGPLAGSTPQAKPPVITRFVPVDDNSLEQVQIGLGALGGMALAGAAAGAVSVRRRHHQHAL